MKVIVLYENDSEVDEARNLAAVLDVMAPQLVHAKVSGSATSVSIHSPTVALHERDVWVPDVKAFQCR